MLLLPRFFYDDAANEGTGGKADDNQQQQSAENNQQQQAPPELPDDIKAQLKELEELRAYKAANPQQAAAKTKEEIEKEEQLEKVNFRKFAVENDLAKDDDFVKYETLQQEKDSDLVFKDFLTQYKTDNPDADADTLEEDAKAAFNEQYHLTSENKTLKARGLKLLEKEAKDLRSPAESKIATAQTKYATEKERIKFEKEMTDVFEKKYRPFAEQTLKSIPTKLTYAKTKSGDDEVSVEIDVTAEDLKEVDEKFLRKRKAFDLFNEGKPEEAKAKLLEKINSYLLNKKREDGNAQLAEKFEAIGLKKGSNVGAGNPYALRDEARVISMKEGETLEESNAKMARARANAR